MTLHLHVRAESEVEGKMSGVAEVDVKDGHAGLRGTACGPADAINYDYIS